MRFLAGVTRLFKRKRTARAAPLSPSPYDAWLVEWESLWGIPDLPARVRIAFNGRLKRSLGRCTPRTGSIRLNPGLRNADPVALREVVCHEAAHAAAWLLHGRSARPHGREWKELMRRAGYEPRVRWPEAAVPDAVRRRDKAGVVYVHACPVCGTRRTARRVVAAWRCRACRDAGREGRLEISRWAVAGGEAG